MTGIPTTTLLPDPWLPPPEGRDWPFIWLRDRLLSKKAEVVTPESSASAVEEASFDLMAREEREVLDQVRLLPRRLLLEFLMYEDEEDRSGPLRTLVEKALVLEVPLPDLDVRPLLETEPDWRECLFPGTMEQSAVSPPNLDTLAEVPFVPSPLPLPLGAMPLHIESILSHEPS